ncbi:MAG: IS1595 family transposase [Gemmatimonadetes bacterium]|nr:IS1595 family transposase [Gemmatimonadota bacterium]
MTQKAPGQAQREGITLPELFKMFPNDDAAEAWFVAERWPNEIACPYDGSVNVQTGASHPTMPMRCRDCRKRFSVKTGTVMQSSNLGYQTWAVAIYLLTTNLKGVSSMKLHRDLGITQKAAWHLAHRLREAWERSGDTPFGGPVEVDETFVGGRAHNMHAHQKPRARTNKTAVAGIKDRATGQVSAAVVPSTRGSTLIPFVTERTTERTMVFTDDHGAYHWLPRVHYSVRHSVGEFVRGQAHTNGVESFWSMLKRGYQGTYHQMSPKHLGRYVNEFAGRHNVRPLDTIAQMRAIWAGMQGKRLRYADLIAS